MSSTIFYKFRSQRDLSRVLFDGTGITVFDLKREIMLANRLTNASEIELKMYRPEGPEYDDDTEVIPRSTTVVVRRLPADRKGKGGATRYITGKPRVNRKNPALAPTAAPASSFQPKAGNGEKQTEEDMIKAMFNQQDDQWQEQQVSLAGATRIDPVRTATGTDEAPPPGYICYRCGSKTHFIKNCPTNNDPNWETKRVKRTTGIPKSYLKTVDKPEDDDNQNVMVNDEGQFVVAVADKKSWETYQKKQQVQEEQYDVKDETLLDPLSHKLFKDPVKTPCCGKTYSRQALEDALLETDFVCPNCEKEDVLLDTLTKDEEMSKRVDEFIEANSNGLKRSNDSDNGPDSKKQKTELFSAGVAPTAVPMMPNMGMAPMGMPFMAPFPFMPNMMGQNPTR
ncbi:unnamed protein product [Kuraishia capsulata CBS 1993]|uniref:DWNN domain-containing protein n=1 Tax=Kuraishia capsulata CBS 1993 TaxID=1382522 RepID=W6MHR5_9ASCO|nr:uncharacterized protein KUCA_T00001516001 [Kuraishia capsulata CBS 1993]CDK25546.1 unnamed protein product [Kuraishia capsulata CBS 1993]